MRTGIRNNDYESKGEKKIENTIELIQATSFRHLKCVSRDSISSPQALQLHHDLRTHCNTDDFSQGWWDENYRKASRLRVLEGGGTQLNWLVSSPFTRHETNQFCTTTLVTDKCTVQI